MSEYSAIVEVAGNMTLLDRVAAAAAAEGVTSPQMWAQENRWTIAASPGWAAEWLSAKANASVNYNPNMGERNDVISDEMILEAVRRLTATS